MHYDHGTSFRFKHSYLSILAFGTPFQSIPPFMEPGKLPNIPSNTSTVHSSWLCSQFILFNRKFQKAYICQNLEPYCSVPGLPGDERRQY
ncbi:Ribose-phosphate pyrophosphokinase,related [Echinococcus multilocularis]|uniref:Ribose-phosphate pyrophosphokinase,related n=1 Tax=Echinococcus multilocularis TaxID=6211 RepID=A0A0S4MK24_ECHMU|nr:Ribose-phosphate pyrophosphokinase,related [Echinococcus multilocularis]